MIKVLNILNSELILLYTGFLNVALSGIVLIQK